MPVAHSLTAAGHDASEDGTGRGASLVPIAVRTAQTSSNGWGIHEDTSYTLDGANGQAIAFTERTRADGVACETQEELAYAVLDGGAGTKSKGMVAYGLSNQPTPKFGTDVAPSLDAKADGGGRMEAVAIAFTERTRADGVACEAQEELAYALTNPGKGGRPTARGVAYALGSHAGSAGEASNSSHAKGGPVGMGIVEEGTPALRAGRTQTVAAAMAVRRLTPKEAERLQGFPDNWTAFDAEGKPQSDSARYRQLGNAVCVPVAEWIARRLA